MIIVTNHAVEQIMNPNKSSLKINSKEEAEQILKEIANKGKPVKRQPDDCVEMVFKKLYIIVKQYKEKKVVITFNGDAVWRGWYRRQRYKERY